MSTLLPTELDEKVAKMRLPALGTVLTDFLDFSSSEKFKNSPLVAASSELSAHQMAPSGVIAHWRGRRALQLIRAECSSNGCPKSVRRSPVLPCRGERPIGLLDKWSEFLSHSNLLQAPFLCCTHAVERVTSRAAGYDCENNATVREGQGTAAETTPPLRDAQKPWGGHLPCWQAR